MEWLLLGLGGLVGAVTAAVIAALRVRTAFGNFEVVFRSYFARNSDPGAQGVLAAFETFDEELSGFDAAWERLKRAFRIK
jgi:hypothetical protein